MFPRMLTKLCKSRVCTVFLLVLLGYAIFFAITAFINSSNPPSVPSVPSLGGRAHHPKRKLRRPVKDNDATQFCEYYSDLIQLNLSSEKWATGSLECRGRQQFYIPRENFMVIDPQEVPQQCEFSGIGWKSDEVFLLTDKITFASPNDMNRYLSSAKHDFLRIRCFFSKDKQKPLAEKQFNRPSNDQIYDPEDLNKKILENHFPRAIGSLGLPDLKLDYLLRKEKLLDRANGQKQSEMILKDHVSRKDGDNDEIFKKEFAMKENNIGYDEVETNDEFVARVVEKEEVLKKIDGLRGSLPSSLMNVLILVLDSVSQRSFSLNFRKTDEFFKNKRAIIFNGYNVVGDAAVANIVPLLTGMKESDLSDMKRGNPGEQYISALPFIWNRFEELGYVTLFAEDQPKLGTFQDQFLGFEEPPVDHYMRPFWLALEGFTGQKTLPHCIGSKAKHQYIFDYISSFFSNYEGTPKFVMGFLSEFPKSNTFDVDLMNFFHQLQGNDVLENTLVVLTGDHGIGYGDERMSFEGMLNERLPLLLLSFPEIFNNQHKHFLSNARHNRNMLTTPFDLHMTLIHLVDLSKAPFRDKGKGVSLFQEIPRERTCDSAGVPVHFCTCSKFDTSIDLKDHRVETGAEKLLSAVNRVIHMRDGYEKCEKLSLQAILSARFVIPNEFALSFNTDIERNWLLKNFTRMYPDSAYSYLQITFQTSPGGAIFEGTVNLQNKELQIASEELSRINEYTDQSMCITESSPSLRKFCFCRK